MRPSKDAVSRMLLFIKKGSYSYRYIVPPTIFVNLLTADWINAVGHEEHSVVVRLVCRTHGQWSRVLHPILKTNVLVVRRPQ
jgi:hypothetical protein